MSKYALIIIVCLFLYAGICMLLYFSQEKLIFFPTRLSHDYVFAFQNFEEVNFTVENDITVNAVLFTAKQSKGVVFFLHGNAGSISGWGQGAYVFLDNNYDVLYLDYRGYGKSGGHIKSEKQLIADAQIGYDYLKERYPENRIIISGTSIGTGMAAKIASMNNPRTLLLHAPYYSLRSLIKEKVPVVPSFILKYSLETYKFLRAVKCPVTVFHGSKDDVIPVKHAMDLKKLHSKVDVHILSGYGHNDLPGSDVYLDRMKEILE